MSWLARGHSSRAFLLGALLPLFLLSFSQVASATGTSQWKPNVGLAKSAGSTVDNGDGTLSATISLHIQNVGNEKLTRVQITDDIQAKLSPGRVVAIQNVHIYGDLSEVNTHFDGVSDTDLLSGQEHLREHEQATIEFTLVFDANGNSGPLYNSAKAKALGKDSHAWVYDISQNGDDPDPDTPGNRPRDNPNPGDDSDPTPIFVPMLPNDQAIGLAKALTDLRLADDGRFNATFELRVDNLSSHETIKNVQVNDDLVRAFTGAKTIEVLSTPTVTGDLSAPNLDFDGRKNTRLLSGQEVLPAGGRGLIRFQVAFDPNNIDEFFNSASASGKSGYTKLTDLSDDGGEPDANGNGQADDPGEDDPTRIFVANAKPGLAKAVTNIEGNGDDSFDVGFELRVENFGRVTADNVQIVEDLATTFPAPAEFSIVSTPVAQGSLTANSDFDGRRVTQLLSGHDQLAPGAYGTVAFTVRVLPQGRALFENVAETSATGPFGEVIDQSTNGTEPDPNGDGKPNEAVPTPIKFRFKPVIGLAKSASPVEALGGDRYTTSVTITAENLGNVPLQGILVRDDLTTTFGDVPFTVVGQVAADGDLVVNPAFDGDSDTNLLLSGDLRPGEIAAMAFVVEYGPVTAGRRFENQAGTWAWSPGGKMVDDYSTNGTDPDPNEDGDPDERLTTPIDTPEAPLPVLIGAAKDATLAVSLGDGIFSTNITVTLANLSSTALSAVTAQDDLATTFTTTEIVSVSSVVASGDLVANRNFDGVNDIELLLDASQLLPGANESVVFSVQFKPSALTAELTNSVSTSGVDDSGRETTDLSAPGTNPDPDGDGDPGGPGENAPTLIPFMPSPIIGLAKAVTSIVALPEGRYIAQVLFTLENFGDVDLTRVQVVDDLAEVFGTTPFTTGALQVQGDLVINPDFDGRYNVELLLAEQSRLDVGATATIILPIEFGPLQAESYLNLAVASAIGPGETPTQDTSTNGLDPDPDGDDTPDEDDPTPTDPDGVNPVIGLAKDLLAAIPLSENEFAVTLRLTAVNLGDAAPARFVQITDDLSTTFPDANSISVETLNVVSGTATLNPSYDGQSDVQLLTGEDTFAPGAMVTLDLTVRVNILESTGSFSNQALITSASSLHGTAITQDLSDNGQNPDSNGNGRADDPGEDDPTPIELAASPVIGVAKAVLSNTPLGADQFAVSLLITVENLGDVPLENVQVFDDLTAAFPPPALATVGTAPQISGALGAANANFDGINDTALLAPGNTLQPGETGTIELTVTVTLNDNPGPFANQVTGTGDGPSEEPITDLSAPGEDPDPNGDGDPSGPGEDTPTPIEFPAGLTGTVFADLDTDLALDDGEPLLAGWGVELIDSDGNVGASTTSDTDGRYAFLDQAPGAVTIRFRHPETAVTWGESAAVLAVNTLIIIDFPVSPSGLFYAVLDRDLTPGVTVAVTDASGALLPANCLLPGQQNQTTGSDAAYRFDLQTEADPACPASATDYLLNIQDAPRPFTGGESMLLPPAGTLVAQTCEPDNDTNPPCVVQPQTGPPTGMQGTDYFLRWTVAADDQAIVHNHIPLDVSDLSVAGASLNLVSVSKAAGEPTAMIGDLVVYEVTVRNLTPNGLFGVELLDNLPGGFQFAQGSQSLLSAGADGTLGTIDDVAQPLTASGVDPATFGPFDLPGDATVRLRYFARVSTGVTRGEYVNAVSPLINGTLVGNRATATVEIVADPIFEQTTIIGKVFNDVNRDGWQDPDEPGLPGVRLATVSGLLIETDKYGRYHIADIDVPRFERGRNFILKLDPSTLPEGSQLISENPRVIRITQGLMSRINFAVDLPEIVTPVMAEQERVLRGVTKVVTGQMLPVRFASGKSDIPTDYADQLRELLDKYRERKNVRVQFVGHTDNEPLRPRTAAIYGTNQGLSEARARQVAEYVAAQLGLSPEQYVTTGRAFGEPIADNATSEGKALNRRVEIEILFDEDALEERVEIANGQALTAPTVSVRKAPTHVKLEPVHFAPGAIRLSADQRNVLAGQTAPYRGAENLTVTLTGHTDSGPAYASQDIPTGEANDRLAKRRAETLVEDVAELLSIPPQNITVVAYGDRAPKESNSTKEGRRLNRRVEIKLDFDQVIETTRIERLPAQPVQIGETRHLPNGGRVWLTEDPLQIQPRLDVLALNHAVVNDSGRLVRPVNFAVYGNYPAFIEQFHLDVYRATDTDFVRPLARISSPHLADLTLSEIQARLQVGETLAFVLRAQDNAGHEDATAPRLLRVVHERDAKSSRDDPRQVWGQDNLAVQTIPLEGSRVRMHGSNVSTATIEINGMQVPVDNQGYFAAEYQLPQGAHQFTISGATAGERWTETVETQVDDSYSFIVGLANLTVGQQGLSGNFEALTADDHFDESVFVDGRLAFFAKAKVKGKYLITAQLDSTEDELDNFTDNLKRKDPRRVFRQLDPDRYYPVYGDDSTTVSDVNTQGAFYLRVDWDRNQVLWGNFNTGMTGTEFGQYNRSLYGAKLSHESDHRTTFGDARTTATLFGSEAQSAAAHVTFRATGGSLYYLKHTDVVEGSEKVWIEVRQRDTEQVVERQDFIAGRDYEVDPIQGRIILTRPLSQVVNERGLSIIRTQALEGDDVFLLADYEYVPDNFAADDASYGGRAKAWLGDHVGVGLSKVVDERQGADFDLEGLDVTLKAGRGTYLNAEIARSEARQNDANFASADGGLSFRMQNSSQPGDTLDGEAVGFEGRINFNEFGESLHGDARAWYKNRDAEFSSGRLSQGGEVTDQGFETLWSVSDNINLKAGYSDLEEEGVHATRVARAQADVALQRFTLGGEVRYEEIERAGLTAGSQLDGEALLIGARVGYALNTEQTLYGAVQTGIDDKGDYEDNDLVSVGVNTQMNSNTAVSLEASDGDRGSALTAGFDFSPADRLAFNAKGGVGSGALSQFSGNYQLAEGQELYGSYAVDPDRTDGARNLLTIGQRRDMGNRLGIFTESQFGKDDRYGGVSHAFGLDYDTENDWVISSLLQVSENDTDINPFERTAASLGATLKRDRYKFASKLEYRDDDGVLVDTEQYLLSSSGTYLYSEDQRLLAQLNLSWTDDQRNGGHEARFVEFDLGHAYRPATADKWNVLTKYSYLYDLVSEGQDATRPDQRVHVIASEALYHLNSKWELGGKLALKEGSLRLLRDTGSWEDYGLVLGVFRARYHLTNKWDGLTEYRYLRDRHGDNHRHGALLGIYRHIGANMKLGVGFNFTDFSDDLKDAEYDNHGWFIDLVGKF